jgi:hypothetical protein
MPSLSTRRAVDTQYTSEPSLVAGHHPEMIHTSLQLGLVPLGQVLIRGLTHF